MRSNLNNILIAAIFNTKDVKFIGNERTFYQLIKNINELDNSGLELNINDLKLNVYFSLGLILGDNLGLNIGFSRSFTSNHFCRFCVCSKNEINFLANENVDSLRTKQSYEGDELKYDSKQTGILENSIFNIVNSYHVVENYAVDLMHDIFEGVGVYNMCHIILTLLKQNYFDLFTLNNRKQSFNYNETEIGNLSPPLKLINLKNFNTKIPAREIQCFIHFFPLLVGDLVNQYDPT